MSAKKTVRETYPKAWAHEFTGGRTYRWWVFPDESRAFSIGAGESAREAWANAAQQIADRTADKN